MNVILNIAIGILFVSNILTWRVIYHLWKNKNGR